MKLALVGLAFVVVGCAAEPLDDLDDDEELGESTSEISGGGATANEPAVGALTWPSSFCTGYLVAPRIVMTAGHCSSQAGLPIFYTGAGRGSFTPHTVTRAVTHPKYRGGPYGSLPSSGNYRKLMEDDVGLFELAAPIAGIAPLRFMNKAPKEKSKCVAIGYGNDRETHDGGVLQKRAATVKLHKPSKEFIEVERVDGEPESGDSGSPLLCNGLIAGTYSWFTWIHDNLANDRNFYVNEQGVKAWVSTVAATWGVPGPS